MSSTPKIPTTQELEAMTVKGLRQVGKDFGFDSATTAGTKTDIVPRLIEALSLGTAPEAPASTPVTSDNGHVSPVPAPKAPRDPRTDGKVFLPEWEGMTVRQVAAQRAVLTMRERGILGPPREKAPVDPKLSDAAQRAWATRRANRAAEIAAAS